MKIASRSFENEAELKYFGTTVTGKNFVQKGIKRRFA
jgi:hypothetical protein